LVPFQNINTGIYSGIGTVIGNFLNNGTVTPGN